MDKYNIAAAVMEMAILQPDALAIAIPEKNSHYKKSGIGYQKVSFRELALEIDCIAKGLLAAGFQKGDRIIMMVPPGFDFFFTSFSMLHTGLVPVFIDPGIGLRNLKTCIAETKPAGFIGISKAHIARVLLGWGKKTIFKTVTIGPRLFWRGNSMETVRKLGTASKNAFFFDAGPDDVAAVIFTSGSTGTPKGVVYSHGNFHEQLKMIRDTFAFSPGEIDLPTFPPYALFNAALGITSILPDMDPTKPARVDPVNIINPIQQFGITNMFASPAVIEAVGRYGETRNIRLPSLRRIISSGGPASIKALSKFSTMLEPEVEIFTPYGSTEAMPVSLAGSHQILNELKNKTENGYGVCVGKPVHNMDVSIIRITDSEIPCWSESLEVARHHVGEIVVKGKNVTQSYFNREAATKLAKILDGQEIRHRMGDLGYFDEQGNLWFCGRKADRFTVNDHELYPVQCEYIFNRHPDVLRTALVEANKLPVLCVQPEKNGKTINESKLKAELLLMAATHPLTADIHTILFHPAFPVDIRHNAKIIREKLSEWAKNQLA